MTDAVGAAREADRDLIVKVDASRCMGHGRCEVFAPDLFAVDDDGLSHLLIERPPMDKLDEAREALRNCPESAISVRTVPKA